MVIGTFQLVKKKSNHIDVARRLLKGTSIDVEDIINQIGIKKLDENYFLDSLKKVSLYQNLVYLFYNFSMERSQSESGRRWILSILPVAIP